MAEHSLKYISLLLIMIMSFSLVLGQGCADEGWKGYGEAGENKTVAITCPTCDYINFTAINSTQEIFLDNVQMIKSGSTFSYTFNGSDLIGVGIYQVDGYSDLNTPLSFCFDITPT